MSAGPTARLARPLSGEAVPVWARSPGVLAGAASALVIAAAGLVAGRVDVALLALPLVLALTLGRRSGPLPGRPITAALAVPESQSGHAAYRLSFATPAGVEGVILRYSVLGGVEREIVLAAPLRSEIVAAVALVHSGPQELVRFDFRFLAAEALAASQPEDPLSATVSVAPLQRPMAPLALPRRLAGGRVGEHASVRAGEGGEFRDVGRFAAGNRLGRIDWRATARWAAGDGDLYVRRTNAIADATVLIVIDSRDDIGEQVATWSDASPARRGRSSLDVAREAASSIAGAYVAAGDRVGFEDLTIRRRAVRRSGGRRHLERLLAAIESTATSSLPYQPRHAPIAPPGALVYLLSSLLDDAAVSAALSWTGHGRRVVVVDVLPPARFDNSNRFERVAHRLVMLERQSRIQTLTSRGIDVLAWCDAPTDPPFAARLARLSRTRRGSRPWRGS